ncbi:MAG: transporter substrate-binding domain-containing protein [Bermanella sp.]
MHDVFYRVINILVATVALLVFTHTLQANELKAVYAQGYLPFSWSDENGKAQGAEVDFINEILTKRMGIKVSHHIYPWARAQSLVKKGSADAFVTIPNSKRRQYTQVSETPLFNSNFLMHTGSANPSIPRLKKITSLSQLLTLEDIIHGHIVGGGWHKLNLKPARLVQKATNSLQILEMLDRNRVDVYIEQAPLIAYQMKKLGFEGRVVGLPQVMDETQWHICLGKKSNYIKIMPALNKLLKKMQDDGSLVKLQKKIFSQYQ